MLLTTFRHDGKQTYGFLLKKQSIVIDARQAEKTCFNESVLPDTLIDAIEEDRYVQRLQKLVEHTREHQDSDFCFPLSDIQLEAPIPVPKRNIVCLGLNYHEHALEFQQSTDTTKAIPTHPIVFTKATGSVIGPEQNILPHVDVTSELDYEAELGIVIGKAGTNISKQDAYDYILGYTIINDVTARDIQRNHKQWYLGKSLDTFCPMGPYIATANEIPNPSALRIECRVNGELRQSSNTELLIFDIPTIIETISKGTTLKPGDIIATGTPKGVGMGFNPPRFLQSGDVVEIEIEGLGKLKNTVA